MHIIIAIIRPYWNNLQNRLFFARSYIFIFIFSPVTVYVNCSLVCLCVCRVAFYGCFTYPCCCCCSNKEVQFPSAIVIQCVNHSFAFLRSLVISLSIIRLIKLINLITIKISLLNLFNSFK